MGLVPLAPCPFCKGAVKLAPGTDDWMVHLADPGCQFDGYHLARASNWSRRPTTSANPPIAWTRSRTDIQSYDGNGEPVVFLYPPDESKERIPIRGLDCQATAARLLAVLNAEVRQ